VTRWGIAVVGLACALGARAQEPRLTMEGYGPARIGMTRDALSSALGAPVVVPDIYAGEDPNGCIQVYAGSPGTPRRSSRDDILYMLVDGRLARIDIVQPTVASLSGIRVGMPEADVLRAYRGRIASSPHFYGEAGDHYLTLHSQDGRVGMRFETIEGRVTAFRAGTAEAIEYVEGCL
jgi:hypothetical protein